MDLASAWPPAGLRLRHDHVELRPVTDDDALLIAAWIPDLLPVEQQHFMPHLFGQMRADTPEEMARLELQWIWRQRASMTPEEWGISLTVLVDGEPVGVQSVGASKFAVRRTVGSGSFLVAARRRGGVGTRARAMMLEFAFGRLGALAAESGYMDGNEASRAVSERLGYVPNGVAFHDYDGERCRENRVLLEVDRWRSTRPSWLDEMVVAGDEPLRRHLAIAGGDDVDHRPDRISVRAVISVAAAPGRPVVVGSPRRSGVADDDRPGYVSAMDDVVLGIVSVVVGALFCFRGFMTMRIVIPIWGAFTGFLLGAGLAESFTSDGFLGSLIDWLVGLAVGVGFAVIAYAYYEVSVFLAMGAIGFVLGTSLMVALGVDWSWLIVLGGVALGALLAVGAIVGDLPGFLLVVLTALGGASAITFGLLLVSNRIDPDVAASASTTAELDLGWGWYALYGGLAVAGMAVQLTRIERVSASMRERWADAGGRELSAR